jgi:mono/diheme cytochrome c family protein
MTDAELGLNAQQASGRRVYQIYCAVCHKAYSSGPLKGPSMKGLYKKPYFPSGLSATDEHAGQVILHGLRMMPAMNSSLSDRQVQDVIAYLHTL